MTLIGYFVQTTLCLGVFYTFYCVFLKNETTFHFNRIYLLFTLIISLCLPIVRIPVQIFDSSTISFPDLGITVYDVKNRADEVIQEAVFNWNDIFKVVYLTGVVFYLSHFANTLIRLKKIKKTWSSDMSIGA